MKAAPMFNKPVLPSATRKSWWVRLIGLLYVVFFAFAVVVTADSIAGASSVPFLAAIYVAMFIIFLGTIALTGIHEFGHAAVAAMLGWRVSLIAIGPVAIKLHPLKMSIGTPVGGSQLAGSTFTVPPADGNWRVGWMAMSAGGPLANIAIGITTLMYERSFGTATVLDTTIGLLGALSVIMGFSTLVPFNLSNGGRSDGGFIYDTLRGHDPGPRAIVLRVFDALVGGQRPREWDPALIDILSANAEKPRARFESVLLYSHYFDSGDITHARLALNQVIENLGPLDTLQIEDALLAAIGESDYLRAQAILGHVRSKSARRTPNYFKAKAVLSLNEGDLAEADRAIWLARRALKKWPLATNEDWEFLEILDRKVKSTLPQISAPVTER
jgi:hypothetical protein